MPVGVDVKLAGPRDVPAVARSLARAFADDPVFAFLLRGMSDGERARRAEPFFAAEAGISVRTAAAWTTADGTAAALWGPPGHGRMGLGEAARLGWPLLLASRGRVVPRVAALAPIERARPREAHWYLAVLGTDPDHQGTGRGRAVVGPVLRRCDEDGLPAYLESSKEANVPYYERLGFRIREELRIGRGGPTVWTMWREPREPDTDG